MTSFAFGHALRIKPRQTVDYHYQNFFIGKNITHYGSEYQFAPFGFSGVTVNRTGDGLEAALVFPVNKVSLSWGIKAIENPDPDTGLSATNTIVHTYTGQVLGGQWDNTSLNLELGSILDAVGTDVPRRALTNRIVGNLPITNNVRLR